MHNKNCNFFNSKKQQDGFSLVELMIAMVISLILIFACTTLYSSLKTSIQTAQRLANTQESLRGAFYLMSRSLHQAESVSITSGSILTVSYGAGSTGGNIYSCLGKSVSGSTDTYYKALDGGLMCVDDTDEQLIAFGINDLKFEAINDDAIKVTMNIDGMPSSYPDGMSYTLALRQKVINDSEEE